MINYYAILELANFSSSEEIKAAHRRLSKLYHPDINPGGEEKFKEIQHAYEQLRDPEDKKRYDEILTYQSTSYKSTYTYTYTPPEPVYSTYSHTRKRKRIKTLTFPVGAAIALFAYLLRSGQDYRAPVQVTVLPPYDKEYVAPDTGNLKEAYLSSHKVVGKTFKVGDNQYIVKDVQGIPTDIVKYKDEEIWSYLNSTVTFKNGHVSYYNNADKNLHIAP